MQKYWAQLTPEEHTSLSELLVKNSISARQRLRDQDPDYELKRAQKISEGHTRRTLTQKKEAAEKGRRSVRVSGRLSLAIAQWHATMSIKDKIEHFRKIQETRQKNNPEGITIPEDVREQIRSTVTNLWKDPDYRTRQMINRINNPSGSNTRWINNGIERRRLKMGEELPAGWKYGKKLIPNDDPSKG